MSTKKIGYVTITLDLPKDLLCQLDNYCEQEFISTRSSAIRMAIKKLVTKDMKLNEQDFCCIQTHKQA